MITPNWLAPANIKAVTICRNDTISAVFSEGVQNNISWLNQVHGGTCIELQHNKVLDRPDADASYTSSRNTICLVKTADCLPILMCNTQGTWVAAIHAGWRGLANGIIENTLRNYRQNCQDNAGELLVWLGPAISQKNYLVGRDFFEVFLRLDSNNQQAFTKAANKVDGQDKWYADLFGLAKIILLGQGIKSGKISGGDYCTYSDPLQFYSARREPEQKSRLLSAIWMV